MDDSGEEDLLSLVSEKVHQVMHVVDLFVVTLVPLAPLREELLTQKEDEVSDVFVVGKIDVLPGVLEAHLDLVHEWTAH